MTMINWEGEGDDLTATEGIYTLRVEQMNKGDWWWRVSVYDGISEDIADSYTTGPQAASMKEAKKLCELAMILHKLWQR